MTRLRRRIGFEIELLAPDGLSRRDLALAYGGEVRPVWHRDAVPSQVGAMERFMQISQGFEVRRGDPLCTVVDDISLEHGLDPDAPAAGGWLRLVTDDFRLLQLLTARCDPGAPIGTVLDPVAELWGVRVHRHDAGVYEVAAPGGMTVALASPYGGERQRGSEIVTPPLTGDHAERLEELLAPARGLGFLVPYDGSVHLHVDAGPFRDPRALANLVRLFGHWRDPLRTLLRTNPGSNRLAPLPEPFVAAAEGAPTFEQLRRAGNEAGLTKFFDVNLIQLFAARPLRETVEIRVLPGSTDTSAIIARAAMVERLLDRCEDPAPIPMPPDDPATAVTALIAEASLRRDTIPPEFPTS